MFEKIEYDKRAIVMISVNVELYVVVGLGSECRPSWFENIIFDDEDEAKKFAHEASREALHQYLNENPNKTEADYYNRCDTFFAIVEKVEVMQTTF